MRSRWLALVVPVSVLALALQVPMATSPHEANACSGAANAYDPARENARIETPTSVATDTLVVLTDQPLGGSLTPSPTPKVVARVETVDGAKVPLSRKDFLFPLPPLPSEYRYPTLRAILRPSAPFLPDTD